MRKIILTFDEINSYWIMLSVALIIIGFALYISFMEVAFPQSDLPTWKFNLMPSTIVFFIGVGLLILAKTIKLKYKSGSRQANNRIWDDTLVCKFCGKRKHLDYFQNSGRKGGCDDCARKTGEHMEQLNKKDGFK